MATVRYVSATDGLRVRSTPGGTVITTLFYGNLMYDISYDAGEAQNGWTKVHYYLVGSTVSEGDGWVATAYTEIVEPRNYPFKTDTYSSTSYLNQRQQLINAWYIYNYLIELDWSSNAICAMLGNMEVESTINPGKWQSLNNTTLGYGLTQWTPATNLINWAEARGYDESDIETQLKRIEYEISNGEQWMSSKHSPEMTFVDFHESTASISTLAEYFVRCYERPKIFINGTTSAQAAEILSRQQKALKWSVLLSNLE